MRAKKSGKEKVGADMTPMIDMVFQLLIFFILTLKIVATEGDFNMKMPPSASNSEASEDPPEQITLELVANHDGSLNDVRYGDNSYKTDMESLRASIRKQVKGPAGQDIEVVLNCAPHLKYSNIIRVMGACSGYKEPGSDEVQQLVSKIKFGGL